MSKRLKITLAAASIILFAAGCNSSGQNNQSSNTTNSGTTGQNNQSQFMTIAPGEAHIVSYTDAGFSPKTLTIKQGDTVSFENNASDAVWVASNPHPLHNGYPTTGGCVNSTFDACGNIPPGQMWQFKFDLTGSWGFHNHLNPSEGGTIVVQK